MRIEYMDSLQDWLFSKGVFMEFHTKADGLLDFKLTEQSSNEQSHVVCEDKEDQITRRINQFMEARYEKMQKSYEKGV